MITATPLNNPISSLKNSIGNNLDYLLNKKSLELSPLNIHKPGQQSSPEIIPNSAKKHYSEEKK